MDAYLELATIIALANQGSLGREVAAETPGFIGQCRDVFPARAPPLSVVLFLVVEPADSVDRLARLHVPIWVPLESAFGPLW
jgi:hypothetical protein